MHRLAGLNAKHHVLRVGIVFAKVVAVIGRDHRDAEFTLQPEEVVVDALFLRQTLILYLEEEIAGSEDVVERNRRLARGIVPAFRQAFGHFALQAGGQADQSLRMLRKKLL